MRRTGARVLVDCLLAQGVTTAFGVPGESYLARARRALRRPGPHPAGAEPPGGGRGVHGRGLGQADRPAGHLPSSTRGPGATNAAIGVHTRDAGLVADDPLRRAGRHRDARARGVPGARLPRGVRTGRQVGDRDRATPTASPRSSPAPSPWRESGGRGRWWSRCPRTCWRRRPPAPAGPRVRDPAGGAGGRGAGGDRAAAWSAPRAPLVIAGGGGWAEPGGRACGPSPRRTGCRCWRASATRTCSTTPARAMPATRASARPRTCAALMREADLILALGRPLRRDPDRRLHALRPAADAARRWSTPMPSDAELNRIYTADLPVHAHPDRLLPALADGAPSTASRWAARTEAAHAAWRRDLATAAAAGRARHGRGDARRCGEVLPDDAILTNGAGNFAIWPNKHFAFRGRQRLSRRSPAPWATGCRRRSRRSWRIPERTVVGVAGDGDFQMTMPELGCAMQAGAWPIVLLVNNRSYGTIRMHQERTYPGRVSFTDIENPDFVAIAGAYGIHAERVTRTADFRAAFARARRERHRRRARARDRHREPHAAPDPERDARGRHAGQEPCPSSTAS